MKYYCVDMVCLHIVVLFVLFGVNFSYRRDKLRLSVYYESLDPASRKFILEQVSPTVRHLEKYVSLQFVPFGKAQFLEYPEYVCRNGENECLGNRMQDCALYAAGPGYPDLGKVKYIECEMKTAAGSKGDLYCVKSANVSSHQVINCVETTQGIELQYSSKYLTDLISPPRIPAFSINEEYDEDIQSIGETDLLQALCSKLSYAPACAVKFNEAALKDLLSMTNQFNYSEL